MNFKKGVLMVLMMVLVAGLLATPVLAAKGAKIIKDKGSYEWDYTYGCSRFTGSYSWRLHQVITRGEGVIYKIRLEGESWGEDLCSGTGRIFYHDAWNQKIQVKWDKSTGKVRVYQSRFTSKGEYLGNPYESKYQFGLVNEELRLSHFWFNKEKIY